MRKLSLHNRGRINIFQELDTLAELTGNEFGRLFSVFACLQQVISLVSLSNHAFEILHAISDFVDPLRVGKEFPVFFAIFLHSQKHVSFLKENKP